jgi:tetratricopeptide (TPR) repeat protein
MPIRQRALVIGVALTLGAGAAASVFAQAQPQPNDPMNVLIDQGKYWQSHKRGDLAEQAWLKVLRIDPKQPDALYGMGIVMSDRKDGAGAQQYLARLRQAAPNYPNIDELARRLGQSSPTDQAVNDARRLAQAGQQASAAQAYRQALGPKPTNPQLALEYYQTLGSSPQGWEEARRGLEQLAREHPDDPRFALAYAQHLTYREANRREGIEQLAQLSKDSVVGAQAKAAWRQALLWLGVRASDAPLFQAYLSAVPDDAAVKARADSIAEQDRRASERAQQNAGADARGRTIADGFAALDRGDLVTAKARFTSVLASAPNDGDALGGMGVALLKQEQFAQARDYLLRASQQGGAARWREALNSATYWMYTSEGLGEQSNGNLTQAKASFEKAIAVSPGDVTAQTALGDLLMQSGDPRGAEAAFRMALRRQADNPDAIRGLVGALAAQGRGDEALSFANQLTDEQRKKVGGADRLRGEAQAAQARAAEARGDLGTARSLFEDALLSNPDDPWLRLDLARIYAKQGAYANAKSIMDGLIALHPDMPDAFYASALLAADMQDWRYGLSQLERIPLNKRTDAMAVLQHRLWVHQQCDEAVALAKSGRVAQARGLLQNAEPIAGTNAELIGAIASAYVNTGDTPRALMMVRSAVARAPNDPGLLLTDAGILLNAGQDIELGEVMRRLASMQLTGQQRSDFEKINVAIVVRRTDALRQANDLASAYDVLSPWLAASVHREQRQRECARDVSPRARAESDRHGSAAQRGGCGDADPQVRLRRIDVEAGVAHRAEQSGCACRDGPHVSCAGQEQPGRAVFPALADCAERAACAARRDGGGRQRSTRAERLGCAVAPERADSVAWHESFCEPGVGGCVEQCAVPRAEYRSHDPTVFDASHACLYSADAAGNRALCAIRRAAAGFADQFARDACAASCSDG